MSKAYKNSKAKAISSSDKYRVVIAENAEVLIDCMDREGDTSAGESFFADSLEKAERILFERTTIPGKGGVIIPPDSDEPSLTVFPMRTKEDIIEEQLEFEQRIWYDQYRSNRQAAPHERVHHTNDDAKSKANKSKANKSKPRPPTWVPIAELERMAAEGAKDDAKNRAAEGANDDAKNSTVVDFKRAQQGRLAIAELERMAAEGALAIEAEYGKDSLGPYTDFEWGMIKGKLSALRWVLGEEWDTLDT